MPRKCAEKARKTRPVNSKEGRDSSTEVVTRNLRSAGLKDGVPSTSKACDANEVPKIQHVENQDTDPALCTIEIDQKYIQSSTALQVCNEDNQTSSGTLSGNLPSLNCTDLARNSFALECMQKLTSADTLFQNAYVEDVNAGVSDNITRMRDEGNIIEDINADVSDNITRMRDEGNIIEDVNADVSDNITRMRDEGNIIEDVNADVSDNITRMRDECNIIEDVNADVSDNITRMRDECNIIEDINADVSDNITRMRDESNIIEDVNADVSDNIKRMRGASNIIEDMNADVSDNIGRKRNGCSIMEKISAEVSDITRKREESNIIEDVDQKSNDAFQNQPDSGFQLQHDNVCKVSRQQEQASKDIPMPFRRTADTNDTNTDAINKKVIHSDEDNDGIDRDLSSISAVGTFNRFKSFFQSTILQSRCKKPVLQENTTAKSREDITQVVLSQTKQSSPGAFGRSLEKDAIRASLKLRLLKRKVDNHLFSSQPQVKKIKPPATMNTPDRCYNIADSAHGRMKDLGTHNDSHIEHEGFCDTVVVVDAEAAQRDMDSEDMRSYSAAISQDRSCTGDIMEMGEDGFPVAKDVESSQITEGDRLATTQCWYPDYDKMSEELSLSHLQDHTRINEELSLSHLQDHKRIDEELILSHLPNCTKVHEELILPQEENHSKVQEILSLMTKSEISEQKCAARLKDSMADITSVPEIRSEVQHNKDKAADCEGNQMLTSSSPWQIIQGVNYNDLDKDQAENITDLSKPITTSLPNIGHNKKPNQNSIVSNGEQYTIEANDSEQAMTCIQGSGITDSRRSTTDVLDHPTETVFTDVLASSYASAPVNGITAAGSQSMWEHNDKEELTLTATQQLVKNTSVCTMNTSHGNHMGKVQHNEKDLAGMGTQEFATNDLVVNDFRSQDRIENVHLIHGGTMTAMTQEGNLWKKENMSTTNVDLDCRMGPPSGSNIKERNSSETFCQEQICYRSGYFNKEDTFNENKRANGNKVTNSDAIKKHTGMLSSEDTEMCTHTFHNQNEGILCNKNSGRGVIIINSSIHTDAMTAYSLPNVFDNAKCRPLSPDAQTVRDKYRQGPQSNDQLIAGDTSLESDALIVENLTNQISCQQPPVRINMDDSIKEYSTSSKSVSSPLSSSHDTNMRETQLNEHSGSIQKCSLKLSVTNKDTNQATEDTLLENSYCFGGTSNCSGVIPYIPTNIKEPDPSIPKQNEMALDNKDCHTNMRSINSSFYSDTNTTKPCLTSRKTDLNVETFTSEPRTICLPSTSKKCNLENSQGLSDNLDCYSLSDLQDPSGMQSNPVFHHHKEESKRHAVQPLSDHKGTSQPSNCPGSASQGIFCTPQMKPASNDQDTTRAFLNNAAVISGMQKTLPKLPTTDSITYLSDSQICQLASEDFEHAFNSNETEDIYQAEDVHQDKFERSFKSAQIRSVRDIEQSKAEGKKLVDAVIADLVSVNRQLLRMKREMETVTRVVQQHHNPPRQSFHGKHEFGFRYQN